MSAMCIPIPSFIGAHTPHSPIHHSHPNQKVKIKHKSIDFQQCLYTTDYSKYCWQQFVTILKQHPFNQHKAHLLFKNKIIKQNQIITLSPR